MEQNRAEDLAYYERTDIRKEMVIQRLHECGYGNGKKIKNVVVGD